MTALVVREARPADVDAVVPLMHESSRALLDFSFGVAGRDPRAVLRRDFLAGRGVFGCAHQTVVEGAGFVVATMTTYPGRRYRWLTLATALSAARELGLVGFVRFVARSLAVAPLFAPPRPGALFLANACVAESHRGRGLFSKLLAHAVDGARAAGLDAVELDVSFGNARAQAAYEHLGFRVIGERAYTGRHEIDGFRRMQLALR
jgi:ribosomal protein S18 acetylase RimI-like enzyme